MVLDSFFWIHFTGSVNNILLELVRAVASACSASSKSIAILANQESYTYHQLISSAQKISNLLCNADLKSADGYRENKCLGGSRIGIVVKPYAEFVAGVLGTWFSGGVAVPLALSYPETELLHVMNDSVTKESFIDDGFFKTGDCAIMDEDGYYVILGRTNADIMKAGGYKLSALEIEAVLLEHPAIEECCVLGLPDNVYGEAVRAIVVPAVEMKRKRDDELKPALTLEEHFMWARMKLAPYKILTRLLLWESLPRNAMGKVNKKELKKKLSDDKQ